MNPGNPCFPMLKLAAVLLVLCATVLFVAAGPAAPGAQTSLRGPYLGQTPPGTTPQVFAPDIIERARQKSGGVTSADQQEIPAVEQSIRDCIGWAKTKDFRLLYSVIANDPDFLEVHPDGKIVKGFDEFKKAEQIWKSPDFKAVRYEIRDLRIKLSRSGDVAWFAGLLDDINEWKGRPASWEDTRWTGVLEKRDGRWVMVQQHFSK